MNTTGNLALEAFPIARNLIKLDQEYFSHPWNLDQWDGLNSEHNLVFSWKADSKLIGFALFGHLTGDDTAHLHKILLDPEYRGKGEALAFWKAILTKLRETSASQVYLEVEASNQIAQSFYQKCDFQLIRRVKGYYSNGEDGLIMLLTL